MSTNGGSDPAETEVEAPVRLPLDLALNCVEWVHEIYSYAHDTHALVVHGEMLSILKDLGERIQQEAKGLGNSVEKH